MANIELETSHRENRFSPELCNRGEGSGQGHVEQLRGVVHEDPRQSLDIIRNSNREWVNGPTINVVNNGSIYMENIGRWRREVLCQPGFGAALPEAPYDYAPCPYQSAPCEYAPPQPVPLSPDDMTRADKVCGDLARGDLGSMRGAAYQLQGMVQDDPVRARELIQQIQLESEGAPAQLVMRGNRVSIVNQCTGQRVGVGFLGGPPGLDGTKFGCEEEPLPAVVLTGADYERGNKVVADLKIGDPGALEGAKVQLQGMIEEDPVRAQTLINYINAESQGAPAQILRHGHNVEIVNDVTGQVVHAGRTSL
jgi:hypothetical protein